MAQISVCGVAAPSRTRFLEHPPPPPRFGWEQPPSGNGRPFENSQLDSRKRVNKRRTRGHFLVPEGISAPGSAHVLLALVLLEISSRIGAVYNLVVNKPGLLPWRAVVPMRPPRKHLSSIVSLRSIGQKPITHDMTALWIQDPQVVISWGGRRKQPSPVPSSSPFPTLHGSARPMPALRQALVQDSRAASWESP